VGRPLEVVATQPTNMLIPKGTFHGYGNRRQAGTCARGKQSRHAAYITGSMQRVDGAGSERCSEFGLDHRFNPRCRRPAAGPQLDLESQASDASACRVSAGNNMGAEPAFFIPLRSDGGYPRPRRSMPAMIHLAFNR